MGPLWLRICLSLFFFFDTIINHHHHPPCARPLPRGQSIRYITLGFSILCTGRCALYVPLCNVSYFWPRDIMQMIPTTLSDLHLHEVIYDVSNVHLPFAMCLNFTWTHVYVFTFYLQCVSVFVFALQVHQVQRTITG